MQTFRDARRKLVYSAVSLFYIKYCYCLLLRVLRREYAEFGSTAQAKTKKNQLLHTVPIGQDRIGVEQTA